MLLAVGGLSAYLAFGQPASGHPSASNGGAGQNANGTPGSGQRQTPTPTPAVKVVSATTTGLVDFGPYDDKDNSAKDGDDHPLMLRVAGGGLAFVPIPAADLVSGVPLWTADQMSDGSYVFIYVPTGRCLTAPQATGTGTSSGQSAPGLARCDLGPGQRWWPVHTTTASGQTFSQFADDGHRDCLTAGQPGTPAALTACAPARSKAALPQEMAFFWGG